MFATVTYRNCQNNTPTKFMAKSSPYSFLISLPQRLVDISRHHSTSKSHDKQNLSSGRKRKEHKFCLAKSLLKKVRLSKQRKKSWVCGEFKKNEISNITDERKVQFDTTTLQNFGNVDIKHESRFENTADHLKSIYLDNSLSDL
jgi:hypothetical protein